MIRGLCNIDILDSSCLFQGGPSCLFPIFGMNDQIVGPSAVRSLPTRSSYEAQSFLLTDAHQRHFPPFGEA